MAEDPQLVWGCAGAEVQVGRPPGALCVLCLIPVKENVCVHAAQCVFQAGRTRQVSDSANGGIAKMFIFFFSFFSWVFYIRSSKHTLYVNKNEE